MNIDYQGKTYEIFIRKAFKCPAGKRHGALSSYYIQSIQHELGNGNYGINERPAFRQFSKLQLNIQLALLKLSKRKKYYRSRDAFANLLKEVYKANTHSMLYLIIKKALVIVEAYERELLMG